MKTGLLLSKDCELNKIQKHGPELSVTVHCSIKSFHISFCHIQLHMQRHVMWIQGMHPAVNLKCIFAEAVILQD